MAGYFDDLIIGGADFNHIRLAELIKLADQAEPFYLWVEKVFRHHTGRADSLEKIVKTASREDIKAAIIACYGVEDSSGVPKLFDGGGVAYRHLKACRSFFAWFVRDAATQRLQPLVSKAFNTLKKSEPELQRTDLEADIFARLLTDYRDDLMYFSWPTIREVTISRLEGSRRAKRGTVLEMFARSALAEAIAYYHKVHGDYGVFRDIQIFEKPLKVNNRTYDVVAELTREDETSELFVMPVKSRETQGGGHAHLFTRDLEQANLDIWKVYPDAIVVPVVVAENWSKEELNLDVVDYSDVFHFPTNPNRFAGFGEEEQVRLNRFMERVLDWNLGV